MSVREQGTGHLHWWHVDDMLAGPNELTNNFLQELSKDMAVRWGMVTKPQESLGRSSSRTVQGYTFFFFRNSLAGNSSSSNWNTCARNYGTTSHDVTVHPTTRHRTEGEVHLPLGRLSRPTVTEPAPWPRCTQAWTPT